jgi:CheY-like chemotaxis protein
MDISMPEMNGYEATKIIKSERKNTPVISLTAYAMVEDREKSVQAGCDEYISKPYNPAELINIIGEYIK